ncbi:hypothetical protein FEM33_17205 [Dyadobacter flavalbus]|uniref:Uncharacterized protein n=1 Tax=Dyadobacter flavalbus TaxID=2579942 RepID=A0A5M8QQG3_9BACT|nr:hypothetical protein [Dyadobacter flavalbus]KAA6438425.1 hypothetical protein FEM33_17205 [Dyadobacter flavalbus]
MHFDDSVYGGARIEEPALINLINTEAFEGLGHLGQHGITGFLNITQPVTRQQHFVGVMLLTRFLGSLFKRTDCRVASWYQPHRFFTDRQL